MHNDKEVWDIISQEEQRQQDEICLIASENMPSLEAMEACGTIMMAKYSEGYPGHRYYGGCINVDKLEQLAIDRAKELFSVNYVNVQSPSGSHANQCAYSALLNIGDKILAPSLQSGGHLSHSSPVSFVSKLYDVHTYEVDIKTYMYDYDEIERIATEIKPKLIVCGYSAYSRLLDFQRFRIIADKVGSYLMCDMAHIAGLVAGKAIPSPVPYCDIVTTTCHKSLRGVRGAMIMTNNKDIAKKIDKAVFPRNAGGALQNMIAGKAIAFKEAMSDEFKDYAKQVILNSKVLCNELMKYGWKVLSGGTDNHLFLMDLRGTGITGLHAEKVLEKTGIAVNKNAIPFDTESPMITSGLRIGTPSVTTRGMKEEEMKTLAYIIDKVLKDSTICADSSKYIPNISYINMIEELTSKFPIRGEL